MTEMAIPETLHRGESSRMGVFELVLSASQIPRPVDLYKQTFQVVAEGEKDSRCVGSS